MGNYTNVIPQLFRNTRYALRFTHYPSAYGLVLTVCGIYLIRWVAGILHADFLIC